MRSSGGAGDFGGQALVHLRRDGDGLGHFVLLGRRALPPWRSAVARELRWSDFIVNFLTGKEAKPRVWP